MDDDNKTNLLLRIEWTGTRYRIDTNAQMESGVGLRKVRQSDTEQGAILQAIRALLEVFFHGHS